MFLESLFSPRHNEAGSNAVSWKGNGEMTYWYPICLQCRERHKHVQTVQLLNLYELITNYVNK